MYSCSYTTPPWRTALSRVAPLRVLSGKSSGREGGDTIALAGAGHPPQLMRVVERNQ